MTRILTTHVGSLPRSQRVTELIFARENEGEYEPGEYDRTIAAAVKACVARQVEAGVDLVSDGEQSKISYATYIKDRITGFEGDSPRRTPQDLEAFPSFMKRLASSGGTPNYKRPRCTGPIGPKTIEPLTTDIRNMHAAIAATPPTGAFMNAASPGVIALFQPNDFYPSYEAYLEALAEAMRPEYEAIVAASFILQLDCPDRVIAGTDCGFSTFAGFGNVDPEIVYAKFAALAEGAAIASRRLWGRNAA